MKGSLENLGKAGAITSPAVAAIALIVVQLLLLGLIGDIFVSVMIFGLGYATCYLQKK
jgi:hypothetical protein